MDVTHSFYRDIYQRNFIDSHILEFKSRPFRPLAKKEPFDQQVFEMEKEQPDSYLESEIEDHYTMRDLELNQLFISKQMKIPRVATKELGWKRNSWDSLSSGLQGYAKPW